MLALDAAPGNTVAEIRAIQETSATRATSLNFITWNGTALATRIILTPEGDLNIADGGDIILGTTNGTKIGTTTTQKIGFFNTTPVVQPAAVANATDAASVIARLNDLLARLRTIGIIDT